MKFTISVIITAALYGLASAMPEPARLAVRYVRDECVNEGGTWRSCEYPDYYLHCDDGKPSLFTCDGGCQASGCNIGDSACTPIPLCVNEQPTPFPP